MATVGVGERTGEQDSITAALDRDVQVGKDVGVAQHACHVSEVLQDERRISHPDAQAHVPVCWQLRHQCVQKLRDVCVRNAGAVICVAAICVAAINYSTVHREGQLHDVTSLTSVY